MLEQPVPVDGEVIPFSDYFQTLNQHCQQFVAGKEAEFQQQTHNIKAKILGIASCVIAACLIVSTTFITSAQKKAEIAITEAEQRVIAAEDAMAKFAQKFEHVAEFNDGDISISDNLIAVSDVILEESSDILNAVNFACQLTCVSDAYGISVEQDAVLIVILKDGTVKEYDLWNDSYPYRSRVRLSKGGVYRTAKIGQHEFYDIKVSDILYIKLSNLGVWSLKQYHNDDIATGYEIELYDASKVEN